MESNFMHDDYFEASLFFYAIIIIHKRILNFSISYISTTILNVCIKEYVDFSLKKY